MATLVAVVKLMCLSGRVLWGFSIEDPLLLVASVLDLHDYFCVFCSSFEQSLVCWQPTEGSVCVVRKRGLGRLDPEEIVGDYYPQLFRSAFLLTGNRAEAEDLAQEAILRALGAWRRFRGASSRKTWLYGILLNVHRSSVRSDRRHWDRMLRWFQRRLSDDSPVSPEDSAMQKEWQKSLWHGVAQLPMLQQQAVLLRFHGELSYDEIAQAMSCPIGTVKSRLNTALKRLAENPAIQELKELAIEV
ncbi:MAG: RNA polymerase sigma factor [Planctomycetota bacterium]